MPLHATAHNYEAYLYQVQMSLLRIFFRAQKQEQLCSTEVVQSTTGSMEGESPSYFIIFLNFIHVLFSNITSKEPGGEPVMEPAYFDQVIYLPPVLCCNARSPSRPKEEDEQAGR